MTRYQHHQFNIKKQSSFHPLFHILFLCAFLAITGIPLPAMPAEPHVIHQSSLRDDTQLGLSRLYQDPTVKPFLDDPERIQTDRRGELLRFFQDEFEKNKSEKNLHAAIVKKAALYLAAAHFLLHELIPLALDDVTLNIYPESPLRHQHPVHQRKNQPPAGYRLSRPVSRPRLRETIPDLFVRISRLQQKIPRQPVAGRRLAARAGRGRRAASFPKSGRAEGYRSQTPIRPPGFTAASPPAPGSHLGPDRAGPPGQGAREAGTDGLEISFSP